MTRSYRALVAVAAILAVGLALLARVPRRAPGVGHATPAPRPAAALALDVVDGAVRPARAAVAKGSDVTVTIANRDRVPRTIALLGYAGRVAPARVAAGDTLHLRFDAALPGADFAWLVDGRPAGAFAVTGSHLVAGHR